MNGGTEQEHNGVTWVVPDNVDVSPSVTVTGGKCRPRSSLRMVN